MNTRTHREPMWASKTMKTINMPWAMMSLCNRVVDEHLDAVELKPTDLERQALRWAWPLAKRAGLTKGVSMRWHHKKRDQWLRFEADQHKTVFVHFDSPDGGGQLRLQPGLPKEQVMPKDRVLFLEGAA